MTDPSVKHNKEGDATPSSVLLRARANDRQAWDRLAALVGPLIYHWCRQWGLQSSDARDVGQEVLMVVLRKLDTFRKEKPSDTFRGWLRVIARHKFVDFVRTRQPVSGGSDVHRMIEQAAEEPDPESMSEETRLLHRQAVEMIRSECSEVHWQAFSRVVMDGQSAKDVAEELGISVNAIYLAKSRILRRIREDFADVLEPSPDS